MYRTIANEAHPAWAPIRQEKKTAPPPPPPPPPATRRKEISGQNIKKKGENRSLEGKEHSIVVVILPLLVIVVLGRELGGEQTDK